MRFSICMFVMFRGALERAVPLPYLIVGYQSQLAVVQTNARSGKHYCDSNGYPPRQIKGTSRSYTVTS